MKLPMTHQNRSPQGWQWLCSWMGLTTTPPILLALLLLAGAGRWTPEAAAQTTHTLSPLEIYEGERLTFTFQTTDTSVTNGGVLVNNPNIQPLPTASYTSDYLLYEVGAENPTSNTYSNGSYVIEPIVISNGSIQFDLEAVTDNTSENDETITVRIFDYDNDYNFDFQLNFTVTLKDGARPASGDGVTISPTSLALTELGAANLVEKTYTVVLDTDPTANVTVTVANGDNTAVAVDTDSGTNGDQSTLTFTAGGDGSGSGAGNGNWATAQTVTVRALNDGDALAESFNLTHSATATGSTAPYHNITIDPVAITTTDAGHGVVVSESTLSVAENDETATYTVVLKSQPSGNVEITTTSGATGTATASPATLTFGSSTWNSPQTVTVTGKGSGSTSISHAVATSADSTNYPTSTTIPAVTVTVTAQTVPTLKVEGDLSVTEGDSGTITLTLSQALSQAITLEFTAQTILCNLFNCPQGTSSASPNEFSLSITSITFSAGDTTKSLTFTTTEDSANEGTEVFLLGISSTNLNLITIDDDTPADVDQLGIPFWVISIFDDDNPANPNITITPGTSPVTEGTNATFTVTATPAPASATSVSVAVSEETSGGQDFVAAGNEITHTVSIPTSGTATLTIPTVGDSTEEPHGAVTAVVQTGTGYTVGNPSSAMVTVNDDDGPGVTISPTSLALTELGASSAIEKTYTVVLDTDPTANVTVTVANGDNTAVAVDTDSGTNGDQSTLTFTAGGDGSGSGAGNGNWATAQTVTVRALNDGDALAESFNLTHSATATGSTAPYHNITIDPVAITTTDAGHGVVVSESSLSVAENDETATYTVVLKSQPSGNVQITTTSGATGTATVSPATLTFGSSTWNTPQTVTVTGKGAGSTSISHAVETSADTTNYPTTTTIPSVAVTVTEVIIPTLKVESAGGFAVAEGDAFALTLTLSQPATRAITLTIGATVTWDCMFISCPDGATMASTSDLSVVTARAVNFALGETTKTVSIMTTEDSATEGTELFILDVSGLTPTTEATIDPSTPANFVSFGVPHWFVRILDDDTKPTVSIAGGAAVTEGDKAQFTVSVAQEVAADLTVDLTVSDASGSDFIAAGNEGSKSVTIAKGTKSATYEVQTVGDAMDEANGDITVAIASNTDYTTGTPSSAMVTVNDDDGTSVLPVLSIALPSVEGLSRNTAGQLVFEEAGTEASFDVTLDPSPSADFTACIRVTETGGDRVAAGAEGLKAVTVPSTGSLVHTITWTATAADDRDSVVTVEAVAPNTVGCSAANGAYTVSSTDASDTALIRDDDPTTVELTSSDSQMGEGDASNTATLTFRLGRQLHGGEVVVVPFTLATTTGARLPGNATPDFTVSATGTEVSITGANTATPRLTFTGHGTNTVQTATVTLTPVANRNDGDTAREEITATLAPDSVLGTTSGGGTTVGGGATRHGTNYAVDLTLEDLPVVTISGGSAVTEGTDASFTVNASPAPTANLDVTVAVTQSGDFVDSSNRGAKTVTIPASQPSATYTVATVNDMVDEANGSVTVTVNNGQGYTVGSTAAATVTVNDNDTAAVTISESGGTSVSEASGAGRTDTYTVVLATQPTHGVTITPTSSNTAAATVSSALTFTTSNWSAPQTVTVTGVDDNVDNPGGGRDVSISHAATSTDPNYAIGSAGSVEATVTDDDATTVTLAAAAGNIEEGQTKEFTITLGRGLVDGEVLTAPLTFSGTATRGTDYTMTGATVTGVQYNNLNSGNASVVFTGPQSGATATTATITLSATSDSTVESTAETVDIAFGTITNTGLTSAGGVSETDSLAEFNISDAGPGAGVTVSTNSLALTELGAANLVEKTYTIVLDTDPGADVTITVTNGDNTAVAVDTDSGTNGDQSTLTFTAGGDGSGSGEGNGNWATAQTVTVRALNDADALAESFNLTHSATATGSTAPYHNIAIDPVAITTTDAGHGVVVSESTLSVAENDETATYTVVLKSQPSGNVQITTTSGATGTATVSPATLTFGSSTWNSPQTVTVTGKGAGSTSISHAVATSADTTNYPTTTTIPSVAVTVTAVAAQVLDLSSDGDNIEGTNVTVTVTATGAGAGLLAVAGGTSLLTFSGGGITSSDYSFSTGSNWILSGGPPPSWPFNIDLSSDNLDEPNERMTVGLQNLPSGYSAGTTASFRIIDQDPTTVTLAGGGTVAEDGTDSADVTVTLSRNLVAGETVTVPLAITGSDITAGDYTIVRAPGSSLNRGVTLNTSNPHSAAQPAVVFTGHGTNTVQVATLRVTAVQDNRDEGASEALSVGFGSGNRAVTSNLDRISGTGTGGTTTAGTATVTITDDDGAGFAISETNDDTTVSEASGAGNTDTYTVRLATEPAASVEITVTSGDTAAATVSPSTLTFTTSNWSTLQTVTVTGVDDNVDQTGNRSATISHSATSTDARYNNISIANVTATVVDNDTAAVNVNDSGGVSVTEASGAGRTDTYTVALSTRPTHSVTITPTSGDTAAATVSSALTFTTSNWSAPQTVTVTGVDDNVDQTGNRSVTISHSATSTDGKYNNINIANVTATVVDNDGAGVTITETGTPQETRVTEASGAGRTDTYTVVLDTQPTHSVTITPTSSNTAAATVSGTLTFTTSNWNTPQPVTLTGVDDNTDNPGGGREVSISHGASSTDPSYTITSAGSVEATVSDDDATTVTLSGAGSNMEEGETKEFTITLGRGLVQGETLTAPLTFGGTATRGTDYTMTGTVADGVQYNNLNSGGATVVFTGPQSGATATTATITLSATADSTTESTAETVDINFGTITNTGLTDAGGVTPTDSLGAFTISDGTPTDTTAPRVTSIRRQSPSSSSTDADSLTWRVTFNEAVQNVDAGDFQVSGANATLAVTQVGATNAYDVTASGGNLVGLVSTTVTLSFANGQNIQDTSSNALTNTTPTGDNDNSFVVDNTSPPPPSARPPAPPAVPVVSIAAGETINEGKDAKFTLTATPAPAQGNPVTVNLMLSASGEVISSGETGSRSVTIHDSGTATITVSTEDDAVWEEDGIITASVIRGTGYRPHSRRGSASIRVRDNDDIPGLLLSPERLTVEQGGSNVYTVTLDDQPGAEVTVSISIREPEGVELSLDPAVLTFSPRDWDRPQPVRVTAPETAELVGRDITLLHRVSVGAHEGSTARLVVEVMAADPLRLKAWHLRFGRTVSQQVVDALQDRFAAPTTTGLELTVAGEAVSSPPALAENDRVLSKALGFENLTGEELLEGSSFSFAPQGEAGAPQLAFWGQGAFSSFSGQEEEVSLDGDVTTLLVGADWSTGRWQAGAALSRSWGNVSYDGDDNAEGEISTTLTGLFPYGRYALTPRLNLWATAGYGWGDLSLTPDDTEEEYKPDTTMTMVALGMDGLLLDGGSEGVSLNATADLLSLNTSSEEIEGLESSEGKVSRFRLGLEATRPFPFANGSSLLPSLEVGIRQDNGDAETGFGMDLGAGVTWEDPQRGISGELKGRTLLSHAEEEFQDQGLALSFSWDPSPSNRGPSLSMGHTMGATATADMDALFNPATFEQTDGNASNGQQFAAELAYGFPFHNDRLTLTPAVAMALSPTSRNYGLLWSLAPYTEQMETDPWQFSIEAERQEHTSPSTPTDHSLKLRFSTLL